MNVRSRLVHIVILLVMLSQIACTTRSQYETMVDEGLSSGERFDSLFLGISLGMTDSAFYATCWKLNKEQVIYQGSRNLTVSYKFDDLGEDARFEFYPEFRDGKIVTMPGTIIYEGWAPWNREMFSDSLQVKVLELFKEWYGDEFLEVRHPEHGPAYVRVDGNRQISIFILDDQRVKVLFTDLLAKKEEDDKA